MLNCGTEINKIKLSENNVTVYSPNSIHSLKKICWVIGLKPNNDLDSWSAMQAGDLIYWFLCHNNFW